MELPKIDNSSLLEKTYLILKERIVQRKFSPNEKLSIPQLSAQLGVSRTPIRDALNRLEMDGLVKTIPKVGTYVNAIEISDVLDLIDARLMLEFWVLVKLPSLPKAELIKKTNHLAKIVQQATRLVETSSLESFLKSDYNLKFHIAYINLGNNKKITDIYLGIMNYHFWAVEHSLITKEMVMSAINQHSAVVTALQGGKFLEAKTLIKLHLDDSKESLIARLQANGGQI